MSNEKFTDLPSVTFSTLADIICAVSGGPSGVSSQETLGQIFNLFLGTAILNNAGNPNGVVAANVYQLCWDTSNGILYVCTTSGNATTAVWTKAITLTAGSGITISQSGSTITISVSGAGTSWVDVTTSTQALASNTGYIIDRSAGGVTCTLPAVSSLGDVMYIVGRQQSWSIAQGASQQVIVGNDSSTSGVGGSVASTNAHDCVTLICTKANLEWTANAVQGILTIV